MTKVIKSRTESLNFFTSVVTLIFIAFGLWNIEVDLNAGELVKNIFDKNWEYVLQVAVPSLLTLTFKLWDKIKAKALNFKLLFKSPNFVTQALTVVAVAASFIGIAFDALMPQAISDAIFSGSFVLLLSAIVAHVLNPIWHFIRDKFFNKQ